MKKVEELTDNPSSTERITCPICGQVTHRCNGGRVSGTKYASGDGDFYWWVELLCGHGWVNHYMAMGCCFTEVGRWSPGGNFTPIETDYIDYYAPSTRVASWC